MQCAHNTDNLKYIFRNATNFLLFTLKMGCVMPLTVLLANEDLSYKTGWLHCFPLLWKLYLNSCCYAVSQYEFCDILHKQMC